MAAHVPANEPYLKFRGWPGLRESPASRAFARVRARRHGWRGCMEWCRSSAAACSSQAIRLPRGLQLLRDPGPVCENLDSLSYRLILISLRALVITDTELKLIAALAIIGLSSRPNTG